MGRSRRAKTRRSRASWAAIVAALIAAGGAVVAAIVTGVFGLFSGGQDVTIVAKGGSSVCVGGSGVTIQGSTINCERGPRPPSGPPLATADAGCGSASEHSSRRALKLHVVMWCAPKTVRRQYQFKLKVSVSNLGTTRLDIRRSRFVLLWRSLNPRQWSPPTRNPLGESLDPPRQIVYEGRDFWGVFANPEGAFDEVSRTATRVEDTFATHWDHQFLEPKKRSLQLTTSSAKIVFQKPDNTVTVLRFNINQDDLVFYVPAKAVDKEKNFVGLGYYDGKQILALCPQDQWGPKVPPPLWTKPLIV